MITISSYQSVNSMVYQRTRNSRYSSYARNCRQLGHTVSFNIPSHQSANFSALLIDSINQAAQATGDFLGPGFQPRGNFQDFYDQSAGWGSALRNSGIDVPFNDLANRVMQGMRVTVPTESMTDTVGKVALQLGGGAAAGLGIGHAINKGIDTAFPIADEVMEAPSRLQGIKEKAGKLLRNRNAQAAMIGSGIVAGGAGTQQWRSQQQQ